MTTLSSSDTTAGPDPPLGCHRTRFRSLERSALLDWHRSIRAVHSCGGERSSDVSDRQRLRRCETGLVRPADRGTRPIRPGYHPFHAGTIERVFVAGAGLMGHGIAQVHAAIGLPVTLYEPDLARAEAGRERIAGNLDRAVAKGRLTADERDATLARIDATADCRRASPTPISSSRPCSRTSRSSRRSGASSTRWPRRTRSSPRTPRRSPSIAWPRRSARRGASGSSGCTSSARCRSCRSIELIRGRDTRDETVDGHPRAGRDARQAGHRLDRSPGLHRQPDPHAVPGGGDARLRGRHRHAPRTSTPVPGSASTIRWVRSSWPTSSGSTSASASCACSTTGSVATTSARRAVLTELVAAGHLGQKTGQGFYTYPRPERAAAGR